MPKNDTPKTPVRYAPNTPPPECGYPLMGKTHLVVAGLLARAFGLEKPIMKFEPVTMEDL